ncbi:MAG: patatin-like phospholipase family protein [Myxococcales bacterium]|nr:patatin-like phospholipase family protein [Myxococcales bacterium]
MDAARPSLAPRVDDDGPPRDLALTFAGGGNRSFFQLGVMRRWSERVMPRVVAAAGVSAGACMLTVMVSGRESIAEVFFRARRAGVSRNIDWTALLRREPLAPHGSVYRDTVLFTYADGGFERIKQCPFPIYVLAAEIPPPLVPTLGAAVGFAAYQLEKRLKPGLVHPSYGRRIGYRPFIFDARDCTDPEDLADLILASSSTPPFTPIGRFRGKALVDGGVIDNVPAFVAEQVPAVRRNLVVMTRPYPAERLGRHGQRLYLAPSDHPPAGCWDYRRGADIFGNLALGERDADAHEDALESFLADS